MATISFGAVSLKPAIPLNPSTRFTSLSSSSSVFFSYNRAGRLISSGRVRKDQERGGFSCNCLFGLGVPEIVVIAGVAVLLFGPKQLPEVGRSIGKTVRSFQQAAKEFETELKKDGESSAEFSSEKMSAVSEEEKQEVKVPTTKESS